MHNILLLKHANISVSCNNLPGKKWDREKEKAMNKFYNMLENEPSYLASRGEKCDLYGKKVAEIVQQLI